GSCRILWRRSRDAYGSRQTRDAQALSPPGRPHTDHSLSHSISPALRRQWRARTHAHPRTRTRTRGRTCARTRTRGRVRTMTTATLEAMEFPGQPFGAHRVLEPSGALPQAAWRLDNDTSRHYTSEIILDVELLKIDSASFAQMETAGGGAAGVSR